VVNVTVSEVLVNNAALSDDNYIAAYSPIEKVKTRTEFNNLPLKNAGMSVQYFDGLGRLKQEIGVKQSPAKKDIVIPVVYDEYGREHKKYLPFANSSQNGRSVSSPIVAQAGYYKSLYGSVDGNAAYSETVFENSPLNRVQQQGAPQNPSSTFDVTSISYDLNGFGAGSKIDGLSYGYSGNQLKYVNDAANDTRGFKEVSNTTSEYAYDGNGNMITDSNKEITSITYNYQNLPETIVKSGQTSNYAYDAVGVKHENRLPSGKNLQYCANFVYENGVLKYVLNEEGKLEETGYKYFIKDHLGNVRMTVGEGSSSVPSELNHYYPFGMRMAMSETKPDTDQKYRYNGKELQEETEWLDYGARMYDASLGRWHVVDAMHDRHYDWSPYVYVLSNPMANIDLNGYTDWPTVIKGAATFSTGLSSTIGGIKLACTVPVAGQVGGAILISTGVPSIGLGINIMADGFNDRTSNIPGGVNQSLGMAGDAIVGNENAELEKAGSLVDLSINFASGIPTKVLEIAATGVVTGFTIEEILDSDNPTKSESNIEETNDKTTAVQDNTRVNTGQPTQQNSFMIEWSLDSLYD